MRYFPKQKFVDEKYASSFSDLTVRTQRIRCVPTVHNVQDCYATICGLWSHNVDDSQRP